MGSKYDPLGIGFDYVSSRIVMWFHVLFDNPLYHIVYSIPTYILNNTNSL